MNNMEKAKQHQFSFNKKTVILIVVLFLNTTLLSALFISASSVVSELTPKQLHKLMIKKFSLIIHSSGWFTATADLCR